MRDPTIRAIGLLLIVAAGVLLYLSPEVAAPPRWRGGPVPDSWVRMGIADRVTMALPPDMRSSTDDGDEVFRNETLVLQVLAGDAAYPVRHDGGTMDDFRATTLVLGRHPARVAMWTRAESTERPFALGIAFNDRALTLIFSARKEDDLHFAKTAVHSIVFAD